MELQFFIILFGWGSKIKFNTPQIMEPSQALKNVEESMSLSVEQMTHEFAGVRTGKASPALVENIDVHVAAYGSQMKLKGLAVITTPEPRSITIQPFDPSTVKDIERAINESKVGITPVVDGKVIRLPIPELTEERRKDLVKMVKGIAEDTRVRVRGCRKDGMDQAKSMKNDNVLTEDTQRDFEADVQELTDKYIKQIDELLVAKEAEIMKV